MRAILRDKPSGAVQPDDTNRTAVHFGLCLVAMGQRRRAGSDVFVTSVPTSVRRVVLTQDDVVAFGAEIGLGGDENRDALQSLRYPQQVEPERQQGLGLVIRGAQTTPDILAILRTIRAGAAPNRAFVGLKLSYS